MRLHQLRTVLFMVLLASMFAACTSRTPRPPGATAPPAASLEERKALELIASWRGRLTAYLKRGGGDWSTGLSQLRDTRTRQGLRPGRITFSTLAAGGNIHSADGWDVNGLLLGREVFGGRDWNLFIVGIVKREGYRPVNIGDIRLVAFETGGNGPVWRVGAAETRSLDLYKKAYARDMPVRFPANADDYEIEVAGYQVRVREPRSGAEWTLSLNARG